MTDSLDLIRALHPDADPTVWLEAAHHLEDLDGLYTGRPGQPAFRATARALLAPVLARIGWDPQPGQGDRVALERAALIRALGTFDDPATLAEANRRAAAANTATDPGVLPAGIRLPVLTVVAEHADAPTFQRLYDQAKATTDALARRQLYTVLGAVRDPALAQRVLDLALTPEVAATTAPLMIDAVADAHPDLAWRFITSHVDQVESRLDQMQRYEFFADVASLSADPLRIGELSAYAEAHVPADGRRGIAKAIVRMRGRAKVIRTRLPAVTAWVARQTGTAAAPAR